MVSRRGGHVRCPSRKITTSFSENPAAVRFLVFVRRMLPLHAIPRSKLTGKTADLLATHRDSLRRTTRGAFHRYIGVQSSGGGATASGRCRRTRQDRRRHSFRCLRRGRSCSEFRGFLPFVLVQLPQEIECRRMAYSFTLSRSDCSRQAKEMGAVRNGGPRPSATQVLTLER
ncbi:unnamed protein product [Ectocarpus fasciculatus]